MPKNRIKTSFQRTLEATFREQVNEGSLSMEILLDFIRQVKNSSDKKIYIIIYNKNPIKDWDDAHSDEYRVYFIPFSIEIEIKKMIQGVE